MGQNGFRGRRNYETARQQRSLSGLKLEHRKCGKGRRGHEFNRTSGDKKVRLEHKRCENQGIEFFKNYFSNTPAQITFKRTNKGIKKQIGI